MTSDGRKSLHQEICLRARDAAMRFAPGRMKVAVRRRSWRPQVLSWRLRARTAAATALRRAPITKKIYSSLRLQFYFTNQLTVRSSTFRQPTSRTVPEASGKPTSFTAPALIPAARPAPASPIIYPRTARTRHEVKQGSRPVDVASRSQGPGSTHTTPSVQSESIQEQPERLHRALDLTPALRRRLNPTIAAMQPFLESQKVREVAAVHSRTHRIDLPARSLVIRRRAERFPSQGQPERSTTRRFGNEELVWRRKTQIVNGVDERERRGDRSGPAPSPHSPTTSIERELSDLKRAVEMSDSKPITKLDPSFVDRLAEDVIRKVEKRVRIDRERRGI